MRIFAAGCVFLLIVSSSVFAASSATDIPMGQSALAADDLFETQRGYFHPSLNISEVYTDNLFNLGSSNKSSEYITNINPSLWIAFPGQLEPAEPINTATTSAGGMVVGRFGDQDDRPFKAFLNYGAGIKRNKNFSDQDITTHSLQGLMRGVLSSGLSLEISDAMTKSHDAYATDTTVKQNKFTSNLVATQVEVPLGERFKVRLEYSNFLVDYDTNARDRSDNTIAGYVYYLWSPKTKFFVQYSHIDVAYDTNAVNDNTQQQAYAGIDYSLTGKIKTLAKFGYSNKDRVGALSSADAFIYELQARYLMTEKSSFNAQAFRQRQESDIIGADGMLSHSVSGTYSQKLGQRVVLSANAGWSRDEYSTGRDDDYLRMGVALGYAMKKWFSLSGGYNFVQRDSSDSAFNYDSNGVFVSVTGKL